MTSLELMFAGYLHQDWRQEYDAWQEAAAAFVNDYPAEASQVADEIDQLLVRGLDREELTQAVLDLGASFDPNSVGQTPSEWLADLRDRVASLSSA